MKQLSFMVDLERCIGCGTCIAACRNYNQLIDHGRAKPNEIPYYARIENRCKGTYPNIAVDTWVVPCQQCSEPKCASSCPESAISKNPETGIVRIDEAACTGCEATNGNSGIQKQGYAPCTANCPAHINVQGYLALAGKGKFQEALQLIKQENPLPAICGRVCHHPCESACNRGQVDDSVSIKHIKRFLADLDLDSVTRYVPAVKERRQEQVAIIGSGPAGLSCAYYLAIEGYQATIYEKLPVAGGMLSVGIPEYRLPSNVIQAEIQVIEDMGVEIKTGVEVGKDITVEQMRANGVKAVFLGIGAQECQKLGVEGEDLEGVYSGLDFLRDVRMGSAEKLGKKVAVVGGGNVAFDAVRTARRLGATEAFIIYRRSFEDLPADQEELAQCQAEGIRIMTQTDIKRILGHNGKVGAVECVKMNLINPRDGKRGIPVPVEGSEFTIQVDQVIPAIGQESDWACLTPECACTLTEWGTVQVDPVTFQTDDPWIFAGGDAAAGLKTVIEAIEAGKQAAISIDRFIRGMDLREGRGRAFEKVLPLSTGTHARAPGTKPSHLDPAARVDSFDEVVLGFTEEMAIQEAKRCLNCGSACIQSCPYEVIQFDAEAGKAHKCDLCLDKIHTGEIPVCAEVCLTDAITFGEREMLKQSLAETGKTVLPELSKESILYVK